MAAATAAAAVEGCVFFFLSGIRAITAARCLLLLPRLLGVGRLAAVTVNTDHWPTKLEFRTATINFHRVYRYD